MNFSKAYQDELNAGKEPDPTKVAEDKSSATEQRVEHIHNDWIKHQCTQDLVSNIKKQYDLAIRSATAEATKDSVNDNNLKSYLVKARTLEQVLKIITNYGKLNDN